MREPTFKTQTARSRAYPVLALEPALELLDLLAEPLSGGKWQSREKLAKLLGYKPGSGAAQRKIASLSHFGMTQKGGGKYALTELGSGLIAVRHETGQWSVEAMQDAFRQVAVFRELVDANLNLGSVPQPLTDALQLCGIAPRACSKCAEIFMASAQQAGILDGAGRFRRPYSNRWLGRLAGSQTGASPTPLQSPTPAGGLIADESEQLFKFYLSGHRKAFLAVPYGLTENDMRLLKLQLQVLELQVQVNSPIPES